MAAVIPPPAADAPSARRRSSRRLSSSLAALDLDAPSLHGRMSSGRSCSSSTISSRSVRRRDVIRPVGELTEDALKDFGEGRRKQADAPTDASPTSVATESPGAATLLTTAAVAAPPTPDDVRPATPEASEKTISTALVVRVPSDAGSSRASRSRKSSKARGRGLDPDEVVHGASRAVINYSGADPPGESPGDRPVVCTDIVPHDEGSTASYYGRGRKYTNNVKWLDPKAVTSERGVDKGILDCYEEFSPTGYNEPPTSSTAPSASAIVPYQPPKNDAQAIVPYQGPATTSVKQLVQNPRVRIATISSGYKKANFFVREDLDTRIYFHQLEDAIGYMARKGYSKMPKEEESEWGKLLQEAHKVVKKGHKEGKQRYRKGKLVMVLRKIITDTDEDEPRKKSSRSRISSPRKLVPPSPGNSVRGGFKSFSEKFLADQADRKSKYMSAVAEGRPPALPDWYASDPDLTGRLLLTDGSTKGVSPLPSLRGVDPEADMTVRSGSEATATRSGSGATSTRSGAGMTSNLTSTIYSSAYTSAYTGTTSNNDGFEGLKSHVGSDRKGVYGGGVRYFTPVEEQYESESDGTVEIAYEDSTEDNNEDSRESRVSSVSYEVIEEGESKDSMLGVEEESHKVNRSGGVDSVGSASTMSSVTEVVPPRRGKGQSPGGRRGSGPPQMDPISDDSTSASS